MTKCQKNQNRNWSDLLCNLLRRMMIHRASIRFCLTTKGFVGVFSQLKDKTFSEFLDMHFNTNKIKNAIKMAALYLGLPSSRIPAPVAVEHLRGHIFDASYCPRYSALHFAMDLVNNFKNLGGEVMFSSEVVKIKLFNNKVRGVIFNGKAREYKKSKFVISNADATHTFHALIGQDQYNGEIMKTIDKMDPSASLFIVYLKVNRKKILDVFDNCSTLWYFDDINPDVIYDKIFQKTESRSLHYLIALCPSLNSSKKSLQNDAQIILIVDAPFKNVNYWKANKNRFMDKVIKKANKIIPNLSKYIIFKESASPQTLFRYTYNREGSYRGWACIPTQIGENIVPNKINQIDGLYLAGHWTTTSFGQGGISMAAFSGRKTAKLILRKIRL